MERDNNNFEPMLNIPSMEELDRQWKEMEASKESSKRTSTNNRSASHSSNARRSNGYGTGSQRQRTTASRAGNSEQARRQEAQRRRQQQQAAQNREMAKGSRKGKKPKKPKKHKKLRLFLKIFFLVMLLAVLGVLVVFYFKFGDDLLGWKKEAVQLVSESNKDTFRSSETSVIYASNKKPIAKLRGDKDTDYVSIDKIPQAAIDCMVATEDRDFYDHSGVDILSTAKAGLLYVKGKLAHDKRITRGGSTITQQLAKNVFLSNEQTEERKIREMFIAIELEKKYTKNEIMEFYLNNICFANAHFGIEAASKAYFSKSVSELDLAEIAFLCAIPNIPTYYDPLQHYDHTQSRKERILKQLLEAKKITSAEYSDAMYEQIVLNPAEAIKTQDNMTTYAISCATKELMKLKGFEFRNDFSSDDEKKAYDKEYKSLYEECHSALYTGGYQIYTSLSASKQRKLQKSVNQTLAGFKAKAKNGIFKLQGAATCIDNETGFVVAIVGGRKQKSITGYTLNRAFQSYRQPGSSFKPLVVYTPQLERGYTPNSIVDDSYFEGGPRNSNGTYAGKIPLRRAVEQSKNVVAWRLFEELTPKVGLSYVKKMNFEKIVDSDYYPAASLGGLTNGASTVEMASGFATIENDGVYREPTCIKKITDSDNQVVINNVKKRAKKQVYEETAARMMTDILTGVLIRGTAAGKGLSDMPSAGKTGTTSDKKDGWFCGYTPYYTTAVWVGYDSPQTLSDLYGSTYPLTIWHNYMEEIHQGLERKEFASYDGAPSSKNNYDNSATTTEPTIEPDAADATEAPVVTKKPQATKAPVATEAPAATKAPEQNEPDNNTPDDVPDDNNTPDDVPDDAAE